MHVGCHLPAGCPGCRGGQSSLSPCTDPDEASTSRCCCGPREPPGAAGVSHAAPLALEQGPRVLLPGASGCAVPRRGRSGVAMRRGYMGVWCPAEADGSEPTYAWGGPSAACSPPAAGAAATLTSSRQLLSGRLCAPGGRSWSELWRDPAWSSLSRGSISRWRGAVSLRCTHRGGLGGPGSWVSAAARPQHRGCAQADPSTAPAGACGAGAGVACGRRVPHPQRVPEAPSRWHCGARGSCAGTVPDWFQIGSRSGSVPRPAAVLCRAAGLEVRKVVIAPLSGSLPSSTSCGDPPALPPPLHPGSAPSLVPEGRRAPSCPGRWLWR